MQLLMKEKKNASHKISFYIFVTVTLSQLFEMQVIGIYSEYEYCVITKIKVNYNNSNTDNNNTNNKPF